MRPVKPGLLILPIAPRSESDLVRWTQQLTQELQQHLGHSYMETPDMLLLGKVRKQIATDGFTVDPTEVFTDLFANADVTSSVTIAIKTGSTVRLLILQNICTHNITLKQGTQIEFASLNDFTLTPGRSILLRWNGTTWMETTNSFVGSVAGGDFVGLYPNPTLSPALNPVVAPPGVADASDVGPDNHRFAFEEHTHAGVTLDTLQTITGDKKITGEVGFYGVAVQIQQAASADLTGNSGGTPAGAVVAIPDPADTRRCATLS